jgi:hypothetical protein
MKLYKAWHLVEVTVARKPDLLEGCFGPFGNSETVHSDEHEQPSAIHFETDSEGLKTRRRPNRFTLERRVGIPFGGNLFYNQAPMKSADHLSLLGALEGLAD